MPLTSSFCSNPTVALLGQSIGLERIGNFKFMTLLAPLCSSYHAPSIFGRWKYAQLVRLTTQKVPIKHGSLLFHRGRPRLELRKVPPPWARDRAVLRASWVATVPGAAPPLALASVTKTTVNIVAPKVLKTPRNIAVPAPTPSDRRRRRTKTMVAWALMV
jgi:hypothetical protein